MCNFLWQHLVLNELLATLQGEPLHYWRDKAGHEMDFVLARRGSPPGDRVQVGGGGTLHRESASLPLSLS